MFWLLKQMFDLLQFFCHIYIQQKKSCNKAKRHDLHFKNHSLVRLVLRRSHIISFFRWTLWHYQSGKMPLPKFQQSRQKHSQVTPLQNASVKTSSLTHWTDSISHWKVSRFSDPPSLYWYFLSVVVGSGGSGWMFSASSLSSLSSQVRSASSAAGGEAAGGWVSSTGAGAGSGSGGATTFS